MQEVPEYSGNSENREPAPDTLSLGQRLRGLNTKWLIVGVSALAVAMAIIGTMVVNAYAASPGSTPTPGATSTGSSNSTCKGPGPGGHGGPGFGHGPGAVLTVSSVSGQKITAKRPDGTTITVVTSSSTTYTRAGQTISLSAITGGEQIHVRGTVSSNGTTITATNVDVVLPGYAGVVTAVSGNTITVQDRSGKHTITVNSSTKYVSGPSQQSVSLSSIKVGTMIMAEGTKSSNGTLTAQLVRVGGPHPFPPDGRGPEGTQGTPPTTGTTTTN